MTTANDTDTDLQNAPRSRAALITTRITIALIIAVAIAATVVGGLAPWQEEQQHPVLPNSVYGKVQAGQEYITFKNNSASRAERVINAMHGLGYELDHTNPETMASSATYIFRKKQEPSTGRDGQ